MDINDRVEWEREEADAMTQGIVGYINSITQASDTDLISELEKRGNNELADHLAYWNRQAENVAHRTYHIQEDLEDAGIEQASRRAAYLRVRASEAGQRLDGARRMAKEFLSEPEDLYDDTPSRSESDLVVTGIYDALKRYCARYPDRLYSLHPRDFEALVADILRDFGFTTELTQATRDGGRDIYAYIRNQLTSFLMFVECKRYAPNKHVGIDIVQRMVGVAHLHQAHKSMIVTTSFFTKDAIAEHTLVRTQMELKDYNDLKLWLRKYTDEH